MYWQHSPVDAVLLPVMVHTSALPADFQMLSAGSKTTNRHTHTYTHTHTHTHTHTIL